MYIQFDDYEQNILGSVERGEWNSVKNLQQEIGSVSNLLKSK